VDDIADYPDFKGFLDPTAEGAKVERKGDETFLVTLRGEEGGQILLRRVDGKIELLEADNVLDREARFAARACAGACTAEQHALVAQAIVRLVNNYSSAQGPDHGNLACLWAVRHIVHDVLEFWITRSDGTASFYPDLVSCFGAGRPEAEVAAGGIVISPTSGSRIGHIGLLGAGHGDTRLIYSNSSAAAQWKQNHTIATWRARYRDVKGLPVYFFPLPQYGA